MGPEQFSTLEMAALQRHLQFFFEEDDIGRNFHYIHSLPMDPVKAELRFKSDMIVAGLPFFVAALEYLGVCLKFSKKLEGQFVKAGTASESFELPFGIALTGERIALNLLQRASSIATHTHQYVEAVKRSGLPIAILDTRKTTPGLRFLEKYAVRVGGGRNHRFGQSDLWMVKDNHKSFFGGVAKAVSFFKEQGAFYNGIEVEVHTLEEMRQALDLGARHLMLDNFTPDQVAKAVELKKGVCTVEVSGGVSLSNINNYLIKGVDAISIGRLTYGAPPVDISFKYERSGQ